MAFQKRDYRRCGKRPRVFQARCCMLPKGPGNAWCPAPPALPGTQNERSSCQLTFPCKPLKWNLVPGSHRQPGLVLQRRASRLLCEGPGAEPAGTQRAAPPRGHSLTSRRCHADKAPSMAAGDLGRSVTIYGAHSGSGTVPGLETVHVTDAHRARALSGETIGR